MVASIRKFLPAGTRIIQITNMDFPMVKSVDMAFRVPSKPDFIDWAFGALIALGETFHDDILQIATDVLIQRDISEVFHWPYDIAACRYWLKERIDGAFCGDVNFIHDGGIRVFREALSIYRKNPKYQDGCDGGQKAFLEASNRPNFVVRELNPYYHCRTPENAQEDLSEASIIHFRGPRKAWMIPYAQKIGLIAEAL